MNKLYLTLAEMLAHSNTREGGLYKWARIEGSGDFRFIHVTYQEQHTMLVGDGETATSAGNISMNNDYWRMMSRGSQTLKVGCSGEDETALEQVLADAGREFKPSYTLPW